MGDASGASFSSMNLSHCATRMTHDAIVVRRSVRKESIGGDIFIPAVNVGSRPASTAMDISCKLSGVLDCLLNTLKGQPTEVRTKIGKIRSSLGNGALVDASFQCIEGVFTGNTCVMFSTAFMNDEVDVFGEIASALAKIIDTGILVTSVRQEVRQGEDQQLTIHHCCSLDSRCHCWQERDEEGCPIHGHLVAACSCEGGQPV
jgi:hypothetical protein